MGKISRTVKNVRVCVVISVRTQKCVEKSMFFFNNESRRAISVVAGNHVTGSPFSLHIYA